MGFRRVPQKKKESFNEENNSGSNHIMTRKPHEHPSVVIPAAPAWDLQPNTGSGRRYSAAPHPGLRNKETSFKELMHDNSSNEMLSPTSQRGFSMAKSIKILTEFLLPDAATSEEQKIEELIEHRTIRMKSAVSSLKERKMRKEKLLSAIMYIVFVLMYFGIILEQRKVDESFNLEFALADQVTAQEDDTGNTFYDLQDINQMWTWIETAFLPGILDPEPRWYNGNLLQGDEKDYFMYYNRMIGGLKVGLRRVDPCACEEEYVDSQLDNDALQHGSSTGFCSFQCSSRFHDFYPVLYPPLTSAYRSHRAFGPSYDMSKYSYEKDVYGGGSFIYMSDDPILTQKVFREIKSDFFIDKSARRFEITFNVFNGNYQLFTSVILQFEFRPTGLMEKSVRFGTFAIEPYLTVEDKVRAALEVVFIVFVLFSVADLCNDVYKDVNGLSAVPRINTFWFFMDVLRNVLFLTSFVQWILIITDPIALDLELPLAETNVFYDLEPLLNKHKVSTSVHAFCVVVCLLGCFKYFHYSPKYGILVRTISRALPDLLQFMYMFFTVFMVFAVMGMMMFGHSLKEWSSFFLSLQTLIMMLTVEYGMAPLVGVDPYMGTVFYFFFLVIAYFLLVNILLAILIDAYTALNEENHKMFELEQDTLNVQIPREIVLQNWFKIMNLCKQLLRIKVPEEATFLTIEDYLQMLENTPGLANDAILEELRPTVMNPNPEPELVLTYDMLLKHFSKRHARLMMAALGSPIPKEQWEELQSQKVNKLQAARAEIASVNAFSEVLDETRNKRNSHDGESDPGHSAPTWNDAVGLATGKKETEPSVPGTVRDDDDARDSMAVLQDPKRKMSAPNPQLSALRKSPSQESLFVLEEAVNPLREENKELKVQMNELHAKFDSLSDLVMKMISSEIHKSNGLVSNGNGATR